MSATDAVDAPRVGRPRRFDPGTERRLLLDAGMRVMARNGFAATTVSEVLEEAGLSTRAFYRHFTTSHDLLRELLERETASVERRLEKAVADADGPVAAVEAWIGAYLDLFHEPRRAARTAFFMSPVIVAVVPDARADIRERFCRSLARALRAGHRAKVLYSPSPEADAVSIYGIVPPGDYRRRPGGRDRALAQVKRFAWPALGIGDPVLGDRGVSGQRTGSRGGPGPG